MASHHVSRVVSNRYVVKTLFVGMTSRKYRTFCIIFVLFVILNAYIALNETYNNGDDQHNNADNSNNGEARNINLAKLYCLLNYHPGALTIHQLMEEPWIDGLRMTITCIAKGYSISEVDIEWEGKGISQDSLWVIKSQITQRGGDVIRSLAFIPLLAAQAGNYTCHLVTKTDQLLMSKTIEISGM